MEDRRLVVLNARDAAEHGADIATRTRVVSGAREDGLWSLVLRDERDGSTRRVRARGLVNAAGPWVGDVLQSVLRANTPAAVRMVQGSHIVVPRLYPEEHCYILQNADGRIFFVIPYERDFTLIGTTDQDYQGDPAEVRASADEVAYLCRSASEYLARPVTPQDVVWTYSGVRPLYDDGASKAQAATRDYVLNLEAPPGEAALLSIFGGKITTYRRLAEAALERLAPHLPPAQGQAAGWTGRAPLPGGDFPRQGFAALVQASAKRYPFLDRSTLTRLLRAYGTRTDTLLSGATQPADLGRDLGAGLTEAELRYLVAQEWAMTAPDVVWRRSKLGLRLSGEQIAAIDLLLRELVQPLAVPA